MFYLCGQRSTSQIEPEKIRCHNQIVLLGRRQLSFYHLVIMFGIPLSRSRNIRE